MGRPGPGRGLLGAGGATAADVTAAVQLERLQDGRWKMKDRRLGLVTISGRCGGCPSIT